MTERIRLNEDNRKWWTLAAMCFALFMIMLDTPVVNVALTEYVSWRAIFFLNLPVAVGAVAVTLFATRNSRDETVDRTVDYPGIAALSVGLTALILALIEGNSWGWDSARIVTLFALAA